MFITRMDQFGPKGTIGSDLAPVHENNTVLVTATFARPAYAYLLSLTPDREVTCVSPGETGMPPEARTKLLYPDGESSAFVFEAGAGLQAFALVTSTTPLPAYDEWVEDNGVPTWGSARTDTNWLFDGAKFWQMPAPRGETEFINPPEPVKTTVRHLIEASGVDAVYMVAFPIQPGNESNQTPGPGS